jgi:endonuclease-3
VKTAACVLLFSLCRDVFPVDVHVHRLCRRLGLVASTASAEQTFLTVSPLVPRGRAYALHTNLIRFGRSICRPRDPKCLLCPLHEQCLFEGKTNAPSR